MNLLIVFVILAVLMISDLGGSQPVNDVWFRSFAILATLAVVPGFAIFQTALATHKLRSKEVVEDKIQRMLTRLTICHSGVWLVSSLCIVYLFQWQKIVRGNWQLDRFPLLDEVMIIAPIVLSLICSWFVFFDIQNVFLRDREHITVRQRWAFVSLRVRVYLLVGLVPILMVFAIRDVWGSYLGDIVASSVSSTLTVTIIGLVCLLVFFPFMMLLVWKTSPLNQSELEVRLQKFCRDCRMNVAQVRKWNTGGSIINAVVAGVLPYFRVILVSDGLISKFNENQIQAILRHEAGHIRRWHLASRIVFILLPIVMIGLCYLLAGSMLPSLESLAVAFSIPKTMVMPAAVGAYGSYLLAVLVWLSWQMEYDADLFAVTLRNTTDGAQNDLVTLCPQAADETMDALYRFAELMPTQVDRKTFWHPTLRKRLIRLQQLKRDPKLAQLNSDLFVHKQFLLFASVVVTFTSLQIALSFFG